MSKSKMVEVVKALGVELGQLFKIDSDETSFFYIDDNGLHSVDIEAYEFDDDIAINDILVELLTGDIEIACIAEWKNLEKESEKR